MNNERPIDRKRRSWRQAQSFIKVMFFVEPAAEGIHRGDVGVDRDRPDATFAQLDNEMLQ
jgi:hypothetical protein